jgi:hypothetical protein
VSVLNSISRFICALAALIASLTFAWFIYRLIDFDHHPRMNILHAYDRTIYMRAPTPDRENPSNSPRPEEF